MYPIKLKISNYDYPWHCNGGWKNWFLHDWIELDRKNKSVWIGRRFLGFKKIVAIWTCSEIESKKQDELELTRLINCLRKEIKKGVI